MAGLVVGISWPSSNLKKGCMTLLIIDVLGAKFAKRVVIRVQFKMLQYISQHVHSRSIPASHRKSYCLQKQDVGP